MDSYRKPAANRYWKRPKPRVYECNVRDAERFYQQSYKDYQAEKEAQRSRARSIDNEPTFYAHLRAGPIRRETSKPPPLPPSYKSTSEASSESSSTAKLTSHEALSAYDPDKESASLDERLARIKRLREELGLPGETQNTSRVTSSLTRETRGGASDFESSFKSERSSRANGLSSLDGGEDSSYSYKSERSSKYSRPGADADSSYSIKSERTSSYTRPGADDSSSYSFRSERSSRANAANGRSADEYSFKSEMKTDDYKPSPKFERKRLDLDLGSKADDNYSFSKSEKKSDLFSSKSSAGASSSSTTRSRKNVVEATEFDDDDTADILKKMKKLPSSQEILERISKMDLDD